MWVPSIAIFNQGMCYSFAALLCMFLICKFLNWFMAQRKISLSMSKVPHFKYWPVISYWRRMKRIYWQKTAFSPNSVILELINGMSEIFKKEKIFFIWVMFLPKVFIFDPKMIEEVLSSNVLIEKGREYDFLRPWLGRGLLTSGGDKWRTRRKLLTPTFHFQILEDFIPVFNEQSDELVKKMKDQCQRDWVDIVPYITMCTLDIICQSTMGVCINAQGNPENEYVKAIHEIGDQVIYRSSRPWLWVNSIFHLFPSGRKFQHNLKIVHRFSRKVIQEKKEELLYLKKNLTHKNINNENSRHRKRKAFLELLMELHINENTLTEEDIREEVDTFMFEGHDTTAMAISWCLYNVGLHEDIQEKIYEEILEICSGDKTNPFTIDDIKAMKYLECVLKESLRLFPSVPFFIREVTQETTIGGYNMTTGTNIFISPFLLHRNKDIYVNPEAFDPNRFLASNSVNRDPFAYIPFSGGPRNCIGQRFALMEEKIVLANIFRNFQIKSLDHRDRIFLQPDIILRPGGPLRIKLIVR